jgi:hypothetical protein
LKFQLSRVSIAFFHSNRLKLLRLKKLIENAIESVFLLFRLVTPFLLQFLYHDKKIEIAVESFFSSIQTSDTCSSVMEYNYGFHLMLDDLKVFNQNFQKVQILKEPR